MATTESNPRGERYGRARPIRTSPERAPPIARCLPVIGSLPPAGNPGRTGGFLPGRLSPNAHGEGGRRPNVLGVHQGKRETGVPMRRPSIVVLLAVVVCAPAGWTGASVLAQPARTTARRRPRRRRPSRSVPLPGAGRLPARIGHSRALRRREQRRPTPHATAEAPAPRPPGARSRPSGRASSSTCATGTSRCPPAARASPTPCDQPDLDGYSSPFFQVDPRRDGVVFTANAGGVTTKNSTLPALRAARDERRQEGLVVQTAPARTR